MLQVPLVGPEPVSGVPLTLFCDERSFQLALLCVIVVVGVVNLLGVIMSVTPPFDMHSPEEVCHSLLF